MARYSDEDLVLLIMNKSDKDASVNWERYKELTDGIARMKDVMTGDMLDINGDVLFCLQRDFCYWRNRSEIILDGAQFGASIGSYLK